MDILKYIKDYLITGGKVNLPDLGALTVKYSPAEMDEKSKKVNPPKNKIIFTEKQDLKCNEAFINFVIKQTGASRDEVINHITDFVSGIKREIKKDGFSFLEGLGKFTYNKENNTVFEQDFYKSLRGESFGLDSVKFIESRKKKEDNQYSEASPGTKSQQTTKTGSQKSQKSQKSQVKATASAKKSESQKKQKSRAGTDKHKSKKSTKQVKTDKEPQKKKSSSGKPLVVILIILVILAGAGYGLIKSGIINSPTSDSVIAKIQNFSVFGPDTVETDTSAQVADNVSSSDTAGVTADSAAQKDEEPLSEGVQEETDKSAEQTNAGDSGYQEPKVKAKSDERYYLIAGSFSKKANARERIQNYQEQGFDAELLGGKGGNYRVSISSFQYKSAALDKLEKLKENQDIPTWVLKK